MSKIRKCKNPPCSVVLANTVQSANIFCSTSCYVENGTNTKIASWISGEWNGSIENGELSGTIKKHLLKVADYKCPSCGWDKINPVTGRTPLDIDHIDGNSQNNSPSNLRVLCPNCHSLTPTYKALNTKGRGVRSYRKKYKQYDIIGEGRKEKDLSKLSCECGKTKARKSRKCLSCESAARTLIVEQTYPPNEEMVAEIQRIGLTKYSLTVGRTAPAVKKHLKKQGYTNDDLRIVREVKVVHCSHKDCGAELTLDEVKMERKRCADHTVISIVYPSNEEIIDGVRELGYSGYARTLGLSYGSSVRKYLKRQGIDLNSSLQ